MSEPGEDAVTGDEIQENGSAEATGKAVPTPVTAVLHSTPGYSNDLLFLATMDGILGRFRLTRIIVEEGSAVASLARHWCKGAGVRLTIVLRDRTAPERGDRCRRWALMAEAGPAFGLFFNQSDFFLKNANSLHSRGIPVNLVHPDEENGPVYIAWRPGMSFPQTPSLQKVAAGIRKRRGRKLLSPQERADRKRDGRERAAARKKLLKALQSPGGLAFGVMPRRRKRRATG